MKVAVRYFTRSGNTEKLAHAIAEAVGVEAKDISVPLEEKTEILFLGSSVYAAGVDDAVKRFVAENKDRIGKLYNFSTAALIASTYKQVQKLAAENGIDMAEEEFHCRGSFTVLHKGRPNAEDLQNAADFAEKVVGRSL
ncbi:MAG: flavodoxin [Lachnospiraceae bacterium]|nr:flavodoxin [Lachnospiraceae bacterium]